jgi:hypothetical protein
VELVYASTRNKLRMSYDIVVKFASHRCVSRKAGVGTMMLRTAERNQVLRGAMAGGRETHQGGSAVGVEAVAGTTTVPAAANGGA